MSTWQRPPQGMVNALAGAPAARFGASPPRPAGHAGPAPPAISTPLQHARQQVYASPAPGSAATSAGRGRGFSSLSPPQVGPMPLASSHCPSSSLLFLECHEK
jgi:hypothetical protein